MRRPTGGSAILHEPPEREVTYSVVARAGDFPGADDVLETYRVLGQGLAAGLARLGVAAEFAPLVRGRPDRTPAFCFGRAGAYELAVGGRKLVGSGSAGSAAASSSTAPSSWAPIPRGSARSSLARPIPWRA